ncbi:chaperone modulator CbpM [Caldimonas sp. KR1-144]|uniref:chaperone modulator CbpM n=1 Tax=Caldimonas sp. KR1-144 TaxID=3400911 RepID=UPI003C0E7FC6
MNSPSTPAAHGSVGIEPHIVEEQVQLTIEQMCHACGCSAQVIAWLVEHDVLVPRGASPPAWVFAGGSLPRARRALRLVRDLALDGPGVALALDLLDEIESLRAQLDAARAPAAATQDDPLSPAHPAHFSPLARVPD